MWPTAPIRSISGMTDVLGWLVDITLAVWIAVEVVMQVRQYRMGGRSEVTEWGSLGVIVLSLAVGFVPCPSHRGRAARAAHSDE